MFDPHTLNLISMARRQAAYSCNVALFLKGGYCCLRLASSRRGPTNSADHAARNVLRRGIEVTAAALAPGKEGFRPLQTRGVTAWSVS